MAQQDPIDTVLAELRQELADTLTMLNICVSLRRNSAHLMELLRGMLVDLCAHIDQAKAILPAEEGDDNA